MSQTEESKIKKLVRELLLKYDIQPASKAGTFTSAAGWYFWAASSGFGTKGVPDAIGHYHGRFFGIETKAPGKKPTGFQLLQIEALRASGVEVFVVDGEESLRKFEEWLELA